MGTQSSPKESTASCHMFQIDHRHHKFEDLTWCGRQWRGEGRQEKEPGEDCAATWAAVFQFLSFRAHKTCIKVMKIYWLPIKVTRSFATSSPHTSPPLPQHVDNYTQYNIFLICRARPIKNNHFFVCSAAFLLLFTLFMRRWTEKKLYVVPTIFHARRHGKSFSNHVNTAGILLLRVFIKMQRTETKKKVKEKQWENPRKILAATKRKNAKAEAEQNRWTHFHSAFAIAIIKLFRRPPQAKKKQRIKAKRKRQENENQNENKPK